jgi:hypothetical protein
MPLRIKCPTGHTLIVPDDRAGRTLTCPRCDQPVVVPAPEADVAGKALLGVLAEGSVAKTVAAEGVGSLWRKTAIDDGKRWPAKDSRPPDVIKPKSRVLPVVPPAIEPAPPVEPKVEVPAELPPAESLPSELTAPEPPPPEPHPPPEIAPEVAVAAAPPDAEPDHHEPEAPPLADVLAPPPIFVPQIKPQVPAALHDDAARTLAAYWLSAALVAAALFSVAPAVWDVVEFLQIAESQFVARWALVLFFLGVVQLAYAVYLFQLPDWATVWVVTLFSLVTAGIYAGVLGLVLLSPADGFLVGRQGLQLADKLAGGQAALWCVCMVSVSTILAFFAGKLSSRWRQAELMLRAIS